MTLHQDDDLLRRVRSLDPTLHGRHDDPPSAPAMLARIRQRDAVSAHSATVPRAARLRAARWGGPVAMLATAAALAAISAGTVMTMHSRGHPSPASNTKGSDAALPPLVPPDARVDCHTGSPIPVSKFSAPGGAEKGDSVESRALRSFLTNRDWRPEPFPATNWALMSASENTVVFGHRVGAIGVDDVVTLRRDGDTFSPRGTGGCGTVVLSDGSITEQIYSATAAGRTVHLVCEWDPGWVVTRTEVRETPTAVHVLVVSKRNPALPPVDPTMFVQLPGHHQSVTITLSTPLGGRPLIDNSHVPANEVGLNR